MKLKGAKVGKILKKSTILKDRVIWGKTMNAGGKNVKVPEISRSFTT